MHESEELCVEASPCIHFANSFCQMWHGCAQFLKSLTHANLSSFDTVFWPQSMLSLWSVCEVQISWLDWIVCLFEVEVLYTIYYMFMKVTCPYWKIWDVFERGGFSAFLLWWNTATKATYRKKSLLAIYSFRRESVHLCGETEKHATRTGRWELPTWTESWKKKEETGNGAMIFNLKMGPWWHTSSRKSIHKGPQAASSTGN